MPLLDEPGFFERIYAKIKTPMKTAVFLTVFLAPKMKFCLTIDVCGIIGKHKTIECFTDSQKLLGRNQFLEMLKGKKN